MVVEIACDGLQVSTRYPGGVALRFARVLRYRPDKAAEEADTIDTVKALSPIAGLGELVERDRHRADLVANACSTRSRGSGVGSTVPGEPGPHLGEPRVGEHGLDPGPVPAATTARGRRRPARRIRTAASAASAYAWAAWFARRRAYRCCDQPPALVRPWT